MEPQGFEREYSEESTVSVITRKAVNNPFMAAGVLGLTTICGIGAYNWKRKSLPTSMYLIQLRMAAQGTVVACLTLGMAYHMFKDFVLTKSDKEQ